MARYSRNDQAGIELPKAKLDRESLRQALELFRYPSRPGIEVLQRINFGATSEQRIAFVGPSGAGKSTLISL